MKPADQPNEVARQYRKADNLNARITLHQQYSTNQQDWHRWLYDQFDLPNEIRLLELGCGSGTFWKNNRERIPESWQITLSDLSEGMLEKTKANLQDTNSKFRFEIIHVEDIPYEDNTFDVVLANHMLYHVPNRKKALSEIRRVLKPNGALYASTIGTAHMKEIYEIVQSLDPEIETNRSDISFSLENGERQLSEFFSKIECHRFDCDLVVTEAEPLVAYVQSTRLLKGSVWLEALRRYLEDQMRRKGTIRITKDSGFFKAGGVT